MSEIVQFLNDYNTPADIFPFWAIAGVKSLVLLAFVWSISILIKRASASLRYFIVCMAFAGILIMPVVSVIFPHWELTVPAWFMNHSTSTQIQPYEEPYISQTEPPLSVSPAPIKPVREMPAPAKVNLPQAPEASSAQNANTAMQSAPAPQEQKFFLSVIVSSVMNVHWTRWLMVLWISGAFFLSVRLLYSLAGPYLLAITGERKNADNYLELLQECKRKLGVSETVGIVVSRWLKVPLAWGIFKPMIILPIEAEQWNDNRLRAVILHELAHIKRKDFYTALVVHIATALYWLNPFVWLLLKELCRAREQACDDMVISAGIPQERYAQELFEIAQTLIVKPWKPRFDVAMARTTRLEDRILSILNKTIPRYPLKVKSRVLGTAASLLVIITISIIQSGAQVPVIQLPDNTAQLQKERLLLIAEIQKNPQATDQSAMSPELTFVRSFGGDDFLPDEYLLVNAGDISVDDKNNIFIIDEGKIKVFDENGKNVKIIEKPFDFEWFEVGNTFLKVAGKFFDDVPYVETNIGRLTISPTGIIAFMYDPGRAFSKKYHNCFYLFDKNHNFLKKVLKDKMQDFSGSFLYPKVIAFSKDEYIGMEYTPRTEGNYKISHSTVKHYKKNKETLICSVDKITGITTDSSRSSSVSTRCSILWDVDSEGNIIYINTQEDISYQDSTGVYTLRIYNPKTGERTAFHHPFMFTFPDISPETKALRMQSEAGVLELELEKKYNYARYINNIFTDGTTLFVQTVQLYQGKDIFVVDVFDVKTKTYLRTIHLPRNYEFFIKNGYYYIEEPVPHLRARLINKYKIDPAVYAR
jgi:beta-lactamase regulating signal transducer with metallopeptidase domain